MDAPVTTTTDTTIVQIPLDQLHESPFNPRRTFIGISELAASIKAEGRVHQPLLVRPRTVPLSDGADYTIPDSFEVVFGHRRKRAADEAGLATVPCMVRAMSDAEARSAQIAENLQRADVHPIEEAEGMQAMMADGLSADELAEVVGKSRSYVYSRLKLLQACPEIREACLSGKIGSEVALLVARVGNAKVQSKALAAIKGKYLDMGDGGAKSFRQIKALLKEKFTLHVGKTFFDPEDATLVMLAGPCSTCPKLSANAPEFADLVEDTPGVHHGYVHRGDPMLCTDPECFDEKKRAQLARQADALVAKGKTVITGAKARQAVSATGEVKGAYVALQDVRAELKKIAGAKPATVIIQCPRGGKTFEAVARADLAAAGVKLSEPAKHNSHGGYDPVRARLEREEQERKDKAETAARTRLLHTVRNAAIGRPRTLDEARIVLHGLLQDMGDSEDESTFCTLQESPVHELAERLPSMTGDQLAMLLLDLVLVRNVDVSGWNDDDPHHLLQLAELYGIDVDQARAEPVQTPATEGASTPSTAARAAKGRAAAGAKPAAKYRCAATGQTWSGRGLQPAWVKAHLAAGGALAELETGPAAQEVKDGAGVAGEVDRDPNTLDMFETAGA